MNGGVRASNGACFDTLQKLGLSPQVWPDVYRGDVRRKQFNVPCSLAMNYKIEARLAAMGIRVADVEERFVRGAGPGGQKINKTSSTVWLRHGASGTEVRCQAGRSQSANRLKAWEELCNKLEAQVRSEKAAAQQAREAELRRTRPKTRTQKLRMLESKKRRANQKSARKNVSKDE
jgi:protein subunit release factor B